MTPMEPGVNLGGIHQDATKRWMFSARGARQSTSSMTHSSAGGVRPCAARTAAINSRCAALRETGRATSGSSRPRTVGSSASAACETCSGRSSPNRSPSATCSCAPARRRERSDPLLSSSRSFRAAPPAGHRRPWGTQTRRPHLALSWDAHLRGTETTEHCLPPVPGRRPFRWWFHGRRAKDTDRRSNLRGARWTRSGRRRPEPRRRRRPRRRIRLQFIPNRSSRPSRGRRRPR